jgi:HlyD family secretion protein
MTATVTFVYAERQAVLRVPNAALRFRPAPAQDTKDTNDTQKNGTARAEARTLTKTLVKAVDPSSHKRTVYVLRNHKAEPVELTTGITDGSFTEVVAGELGEGDRVITDTASTKPASAPASGGPPMRRVL